MAMRNVIKQAAGTGGTVRGVNIAYPVPNAIEVLAPEIDFVFLDGEHGSLDWGDIQAACITAERWGLTAIARVPDGSAPTITRFLDRGVLGVLVPHVDTAAQGRAAVEAAYFAPLGKRSFGGGRPAYQEIADKPRHMRECNESVSVALMIESRAGLEAAEELAAVEGVDYLTFGPNDLAQALGFPGLPEHPEVRRAMAEATARINRAGKPVASQFMRSVWLNESMLEGARRLLGPR